MEAVILLTIFQMEYNKWNMEYNVRNKTEDMNLHVFNMITKINE